jgi:hypothetical protein
MNRRRSPIAVSPGPMERLLTPQEVAEWADRWIAAFPADRSGIHAEEYLWHIFSAERYPAKSKADARVAYECQRAVEFVVISNDRDEGFVTRSHPMTCSFSDWLVFPPNLAWTMAFTHEDGWLGPYFAQHVEYRELDRANRKLIAKQVQILEAKRKGWV